LTANPQIISDLSTLKQFKVENCCTGTTYQDQVNQIQQSVPDVVNQNTVGSYLYACFQPAIAIPVACTPECTNGFTNPKLSPCNNPSYQKIDGKLVKINDINGPDANIFLAPGEKTTNEDRALLKAAGVQTATKYAQSNDSINYVLGETIDVNQPEPVPPPPPPPPTTYYYWSWLWLILLIIVIIGIVMLFVRT
jgi:hypothetical protein